MRLSTNEISPSGTIANGFDYEKQAWVSGGKYVRCGHPEAMTCGCYGREHEGEECATTEAHPVPAATTTTAAAPRIGGGSPWGRIEDVGGTTCPGALFVSTSSHGGYWISPALRQRVPAKATAGAAFGEDMRAGWFEEDCAWSIVALFIPEAFPANAQDVAVLLAGKYYPEAIAALPRPSQVPA